MALDWLLGGGRVWGQGLYVVESEIVRGAVFEFESRMGVLGGKYRRRPEAAIAETHCH